MKQTEPHLPALRLSELNPEHNLNDALQRLEEQVRQRPASAGHRWALAEMLCVLGQWERALKQLQAGSRLASNPADWQPKAQLLRGLIRAEMQRAQVFAGLQLPVPVIDRPQWMEDLARAIQANAQDRVADADALRRAALDTAPVCAGACHFAPSPTRLAQEGDGAPLPRAFDWISDSDTRLGPVCELMMAGGYRWLAYVDIAEITLERPTGLLDLVWLPVSLTLRGTAAGGQTLPAFMPVRYSGVDVLAAQASSAQRDALLLSHLTRWHDAGETGVFAQGQKTLMTADGDISLLDIHSLHMEPLA